MCGFHFQKHIRCEGIGVSLSDNIYFTKSVISTRTISVTVVDTISTTVIFCLLPFGGCFWDEIRDIPNFFSHKQILRPELLQPWAEKTGLGTMVIVIRI